MKRKLDTGRRSIALHRKFGGKLGVVGKVRLMTPADLAVAYTPGVGAVSSWLAEHPEDASALTIKKNTVLVVSDGSAVLGLGNIGPYASLPVLEGKALILKEFANVDAYPVALATQDPDEIIETIVRIAPAFGGIHLEDFKAPECFYIEKELQKRLNIPVMHDDQHGTAIVVVAALMNAAKVVKKRFENLRIVIVGAGAAGTAVTKLLRKAGVRNLVVVDRDGVIHPRRARLTEHKHELATLTRPNVTGSLDEALSSADAVVGVSGPNLITAADIRRMAPHPIVFALANPIPEIMPEVARRAGAVVVASGRSDYPNQVNNALAFPGVFRGALDHGVTEITDTMKLAAARALARLVARPTTTHIIPSPLDRRVARAVARVIR